jgi:predicted transcriptional regulator
LITQLAGNPSAIKATEKHLVLKMSSFFFFQYLLVKFTPDGVTVSLEKALKALESLGLTMMEAQVYIYLEKRGPHDENNLVSTLELTKQQLRPGLKILIKKKMLTTSENSCSTKYYAVPFENVLEKFLKIATKEVKDLKASRQSILDVWRSTNVES